MTDLLSRSGEGSGHVGDLGALGQDDSQGEVLDQHVIENVIDEPHLERVLVVLVIQVLVAGHIVPDDVMRLPTSEQGEPGAQLKLDGIIKDPRNQL